MRGESKDHDTPFRNIPGQAQTLLWAPAWADNVAAELRRTSADVIVADYVLMGALAAAEAARVRSVALMHMVGPNSAASTWFNSAPSQRPNTSMNFNIRTLCRASDRRIRDLQRGQDYRTDRVLPTRR
jgi:hypothetical protein